MKCPTHIKFFNDERYMVCGSFDYDSIYYDGRVQRLCKDCIKKIREAQEKEKGVKL